MTNVSMEDIKILRERLGAGMMDSKKALMEAEGDIERAIEILRLKGLKGVAKREGRSTSEGLVIAKQNGSKATLAELACETDFVAKNEKFLNLADRVIELIGDARNADEALAADAGEGKTVSDLIDEEAAILGEKISLRRVKQVSGENFSIYMHRTNADLPPQVGVIVAYSGDNEEVARSIAQHIAFADPQYLTAEDIPAADVERERELIIELSRNEGKPEAALPKIIEGRLQSFYKQNALLEQDYARDSKFTVAQVLKENNLQVNDFARFRVGTAA